jgi:predicted O-methyltransferase YrrM
MQKFVRHFILPLARKHGWKRFCEIGASTGLSTDELLKLPGISYTILDPCLDADLIAKYAGDPRVVVHKKNSLDALPGLRGQFDCILIDGDHNWYTVWSELSWIRDRSLLVPGGMIFFHDVSRPYGRRDMYYQPETIPAEYRQDYERKGIVRGQNQLAESGGSNRVHFNAIREGGPKNGVLTAIEDFVAAHPSDYHFCRIKAQYGLGILQYRRKQPAEDFSFLLLRLSAARHSLFGPLKSSPLRSLKKAGRSLARRLRK